MSPPDARPEEAPAEDAPQEEADLASLRASGDVAGLLALAKAYRTGTAPGGRDMKMCLSTYQAAADIGSAEAEYAIALFYLAGGVVGQDLKEGATRLRAAAEKGSVPARVYLGNLYEQGIHYKADPEKADVWYRSAARGAKIEAEAGTAEHTRALAELGCVRHVLACVEAGEASDEDLARLRARAKAHGHGLRIRDTVDEAERLTLNDALGGGDAPDAAVAATTTAKVAGAPLVTAPSGDERQRVNTAPASRQGREKKEAEAKARADAAPTPERRSSSRLREGLAAFAYAALFAAAGLGAAFAAKLGVQELITHGHAPPWLSARAHLVFPAVLGLVGVLPAWLVYKLGAVVRALALGAALGGLGWVAWGTGSGILHPTRSVQTTAFALAGFLAGLLVLGLLGGAKAKGPPRART